MNDDGGPSDGAGSAIVIAPNLCLGGWRTLCTWGQNDVKDGQTKFSTVFEVEEAVTQVVCY